MYTFPSLLPRLALRQSADEATLKQLADVSSRLLALRKRVLPARRVLGTDGYEKM